MVQRVIPQENKRQMSGVDAFFSFDYMGSAEFEFGAMAQALKDMRVVSDKLCEPKRIKINGEHTCWYVGLEEQYEEAKEFFVDQLGKEYNDRKWRLKERSEISLAYKTEERSYKTRASGWWALDAHTPWVIFMKKQDAATWWGEM